MYCKFFGFTEKPFDVTSDPAFLYLTPECREVLATLLYGVRERRGFVVLLGEVGTGKTTFLKSLLDQLDEKTKVASIFTTDVTFEELLQMVLIELGLKKPNEDVPKVEAFRRLSRFAIHQHAQGGNLVIIIDEAQNLNDRAIENLRLLSNFETRKHKLIQIVLAGQPELDRKLDQPRLRQLAQRIGLKCCLIPLKEKETYAYIEHRLAQVGYKGSALFSRKAREMVWEYSEGIPRMINILCDKSLLIAYAGKKKRLGESIVDETIKSLRLSPFQGGAGLVPPRPDQRPSRLKNLCLSRIPGPLGQVRAMALPGKFERNRAISLLSGPKFAFLAGLGAAACLFFVLFSPFGASLFRSEPEPTRFSSAIESGHQESTVAAMGPMESVGSIADTQGDEERPLPKPLSATKARQGDQQIDIADVKTAGQEDSLIEDQSETLASIEIKKPGDAGEFERVANREYRRGESSEVIQDVVPQQNQALKSTTASAKTIRTETDTSMESKVILQLGSYQEKPTALRFVGNLVKEGYDAYLEKKDFKDGRVFFRVRLRASGDMNETRSIQARLRERGYEKAFIVVGGEG